MRGHLLQAGKAALGGALLAGLLTATPLAASEPAPRDRLAVVIGNHDYATVADLANARNDAARMAELLRGLGFTVFDGYNLDRQGFEELLRKSVLNTGDGSEIVFFYAGHGIQIGRRNYLLPTDVSFASIYDLPVQSVTLDRVIELLSSKGTVHVAIIDACRDNPFPNVKLAGNLDASLFETKAGFEVIRTPLNSLIAFSTSPGMVAFDGEGENSPYTSAILKVIGEEPREEAQLVFARVRQEVFQETGGKQVPWESSTLVTPFHFGPDRDDTRGLMMISDASNILKPESQTRETAALPGAVTLDVQYDRRIALGPALAGALGAREAFEVAVSEAPTSGAVTVGPEGELLYLPEMKEERSDTFEKVLSDSFRLNITRGGEQSEIAVTLDMKVNGCDLAAGDALDAGGVGFFRLPNEIDVEAALELCRDAVARNPGEPRFRYELGRAEQAAARFEAAFASYSAAAEAGYVRALHGQARLLSSERIDRQVVDIPYDIARANALYDRGIAAGDPFAIHSRGLVLLRNGETDADRERGFDLLDRSAEMGHTYSMNELGYYFLSKNGPHFLPERGMKYLQASAARGDIYGYDNLGFVELFGLVTGTPDYPKAYEWFLKASDGGHPKAPTALGRMIFRGQAEGHSMADALNWYDEGLKRGDGWGGANGAYLVANGQVPGVAVHQAYIRAAKAALLPGDDSKKAAEEILAAAPARELGKAVQELLNDLGEDLSVDGAIGPATRKVLNRRAAEHGLGPAPEDTAGALLTAARIYWAERPMRPDLF